MGEHAMDSTDLLPARHKLTVDDYDRMAEAGILGEDDRVELIDGDIIDMAPIGQDHAATVNKLTRALVIAFGDRAIVSVQNPVRLNRFNEPQPDFAVFRPRADFYATGERPGPADTLLVIEVADSSLRYDRTVKLPLYARAGIPEVWIVDLRRRMVDVYLSPSGDGFATLTTHGQDDTVALSQAPEITVAVRQVFA
jgi:Uma2 family endonuclease